VITLVLGGARSGKSALAERLVAGVAPTGRDVTYVATGSATDHEMAARIDAHRARRPSTRSTVEVGDDLPEVLRRTSGTVLVDALGTWLASRPDLVVPTSELCDALRDRSGHAVVVSDEVGLGVHPSTAVGRRFRDALGELNAAVADVCDEVLLVVAGRALLLERR
jgi:adenosyl cobinamide kinase/adenosyl cobinamide phosphate guanylyltransferase